MLDLCILVIDTFTISSTVVIKLTLAESRECDCLIAIITDKIRFTLYSVWILEGRDTVININTKPTLNT